MTSPFRVAFGLLTLPMGVVALNNKTHSGTVVALNEIPDVPPVADAVIITSHSPAVAVTTADCMPLAIITDTQAALLHVSRHTLLNNLLEHTAEHIDTKKIIAVQIGPHICPRHFTFEYAGPEIQAFATKYPEATKMNAANHTEISLVSAVMQHLKTWHAQSDCVTIDSRCTYETDTLCSYRRWRDAGNVGTQGFPVMYSVVANH